MLLWCHDALAAVVALPILSLPSDSGNFHPHHSLLAWEASIDSYRIDSAIRAFVNRSTEFTPNRLILGREISMPVDIVFPDTRSRLFHEDFVIQHWKGLQEAYETARKTLNTQLKSSRLLWYWYEEAGFPVWWRSVLFRERQNFILSGQEQDLVIRKLLPYNMEILIANT